MGYLPEALLNYLARLGWAHGDQEIFTKEELIAQFSLAELNKAAAIFNPEKLLWLNAHYLRTLPSERLTHERIRAYGAETPTVYLPTHDPETAARLAERRTIGAAREKAIA